MKRLLLSSLICGAALLAGCNETSSQSNVAPEVSHTDLYYSYPMNGQQDVAPAAPLVLSFMSTVQASTANFTLTDNTDGSQVALQLTRTNQGKSLVLTPVQPLDIKSHYTLTAQGLEADGKALSLPTGGIEFTTRPALDGPIASTRSAAAFEVANMSPGGAALPGGQVLPFVDFSSINLTFTHPLDKQTAVYGGSVKLMQNGKLVAARLLVSGRHMTIDPANVAGANGHDLIPELPVTLKLSAALTDQTGTALAAWQKSLLPLDSSPRATMVQEAAPASRQGSCADANATTSPLTGAAINCVPVIAKLLGDTTTSALQGDVYAELAFAPHFPSATPLRIRRGSLLKGGALDVMIGGAVPAGFDSGEVTVTFISDAEGYLLNNPYTDDADAPKRLLLSMDVAFDTKDARANGAFTQNLLHVTLVGTAIANPKTGRLVVDAVGVVEPRVLGIENAYGVLSFHMASYADQTTAPQAPLDTQAPVLNGWTPGDNASKQRPGDPIVLTFSEPLDSTSVVATDSLRLTQAGQAVPFDWYEDGVDLVIKPQSPLQYGHSYSVTYTSALTDLAGNGAIGGSKTFSMPTYIDTPATASDVGNQRSPIVLTAYPGFPCIPTNFNLAINDAGTCLGGIGDSLGVGKKDENMPLARMPANRSIFLSFSQVIDPTSVNPSTFKVEQVDVTGATQQQVEGTLEVNGRTLSFTPKTPWQIDSYYRYTLSSVVTGAVCGTDAICDVRGLPLQTKLLAQEPRKDFPLSSSGSGDFAPEPTAGGPDLPIYFRAVAASSNVLQHLRNLPTADVNANFKADAGEMLASDGAEGVMNSARVVRDPAANPDNASLPPGEGPSGKSPAGIVEDIAVGCDFKRDATGDYARDAAGKLIAEDCPNAKFSHITGNLDVDLVGYKTPAEVAKLVAQEKAASPDGSTTIPELVQQQGGVLVYILPTRLVVSSTKVYVAVPEAMASQGVTVFPSETGPQLMRIRYTCSPVDPAIPPVLAHPVTACRAPDYGRVKGWIVEGDQGPEFMTQLSLYLDAPELYGKADMQGTELLMGHKLHSYPLELALKGKVEFLPDGRLQIQQISQNALHLEVNLMGIVYVYVQIPAGDTQLNYVMSPVKQ